MNSGYEAVIGLEVHVELKTKTKIFCSCKTDFGAPPNTQICPVCMGFPGTLPVLNREVVRMAIMAGLATNCEIAEFSKHDRKNYFYPDLPKGYQISQSDFPLCKNGYIEIETDANGGKKKVGIERIHIEEDAGKLIHDRARGTLIDCNRCGVPLIEIVSMPDMKSADEAKDYLKKLRLIMLYLGVSDCKMNEGSLRCDVNVSVKKISDTQLGERSEIKNINSFNFVGKAIDYEISRQIALLESGGRIKRETRRFEESDGKTYPMRSKESANDYRYFPEPDLPPFEVSREYVEEIRRSIPVLPHIRKKKYVEEYGLRNYDADILISEKSVSDYFEKSLEYTNSAKTLANFIISDIMSLDGNENTEKNLPANYLGEIINLLDEEKINSSTAKKVLKSVWGKNISPLSFVKEKGLEQINDVGIIRKYVLEALESNQRSVADYLGGRTVAAKAFVGYVMSKTAGRANPLIVSRTVEEELKKLSLK